MSFDSVRSKRSYLLMREGWSECKKIEEGGGEVSSSPFCSRPNFLEELVRKRLRRRLVI